MLILTLIELLGLVHQKSGQNFIIYHLLVDLLQAGVAEAGMWGVQLHTHKIFRPSAAPLLYASCYNLQENLQFKKIHFMSFLSRI